MTTSLRRSFQLSPCLFVSSQPCPVISTSLESYLATRRLGEPKSPFVHQGVFDVEVLRVVEDGDDFVFSSWSSRLLVDRRSSAVFGSSRHDGEYVAEEKRAQKKVRWSGDVDGRKRRAEKWTSLRERF